MTRETRNVESMLVVRGLLDRADKHVSSALNASNGFNVSAHLQDAKNILRAAVDRLNRIYNMPHPWDLTLYHFTMTSDRAPKANGNITTSITFRDDTDYAGVPYYSGIHNE
jgi:hypothetical protein